MLSNRKALLETGLDGAALKPAAVDVTGAVDLPFEVVTIDYEGRAHVPSLEVLRDLSRELTVRLAIPVRADGFDPLGDDSVLRSLPEAIDAVLVAGHPTYLTAREARRAIAPRFGSAVERFDDPWVGTESVERIALATGATQYLLLSPTAEQEIRALRAAGFSGGLAVYAPTVITDDDDEVLDALGDYVARRRAIRRTLPAGAETDRRAAGAGRRVLLEASEEYALFGDVERISGRVQRLKDAGADRVVGYPARGLDAFGGRD